MIDAKFPLQLFVNFFFYNKKDKKQARGAQGI